jgi:hypothetical protein
MEPIQPVYLVILSRDCGLASPDLASKFNHFVHYSKSQCTPNSSDEFEPITKRIRDVAVWAPFEEYRVRRDSDAIVSKTFEQRRIVSASKGRMCLLCRSKRLVDA